jgi:hypothetical protein
VRQRKTVANGTPTTTKTCGFVFTTTGRPCGHHVADGELYCRAGHPCAAGGTRRGEGGRWARHHVFPRPGAVAATWAPDRHGRATELLARALSHEDADADEVCADRVLADPAVALALLGSPDASPTARDGVVQRFGFVGALLVVGHEDRWRRHIAVLSGEGEVTAADDEVSIQIERLIKQFAHLDVRKLEDLLGAIDRAETGAPVDEMAAARRRLHATYAVAARDGSDISHHQYMESLNEVLRMTRPAVAS